MTVAPNRGRRAWTFASAAALTTLTGAVAAAATEAPPGPFEIAQATPPSAAGAAETEAEKKARERRGGGRSDGQGGDKQRGPQQSPGGPAGSGPADRGQSNRGPAATTQPPPATRQQAVPVPQPTPLQQPPQQPRRDTRTAPGFAAPPPSNAPPAIIKKPVAPPATESKSVQPPPAATFKSVQPPPAPTGPAARTGGEPSDRFQRRDDRRDDRRDARPTLPPPAGAAPQVTQPSTTVEPPRAGSDDAQRRFRFDRRPDDGRADRSPRRLEAIKEGRRESVEAGGRRTIIREPDNRVIVKQNNRVFIQSNHNRRFERFSQGAREERRRDGTRVTIVDRPGGIQIYTVVDRDGRLLHRYRRDRSGREITLFDNRRRDRLGRRITTGLGIGLGIGVGALIARSIVDVPPPRIRIPREKYIVDFEYASEDDLYEAFSAPPIDEIERSYTLDEVLYSPRLRDRMRRVDMTTINFEFGSWEVEEAQYGKLERIARAMLRVIDRNPGEMFLVEGYTDAVGSEEDNLTLSDRRAEAVAVILTEEFNVPPENLTTQGYGEEFLKVETDGPERLNRRVAFRRITPLLSDDSYRGRDDGRRDDRDDRYRDDDRRGR